MFKRPIPQMNKNWDQGKWYMIRPPKKERSGPFTEASRLQAVSPSVEEGGSSWRLRFPILAADHQVENGAGQVQLCIPLRIDPRIKDD